MFVNPPEKLVSLAKYFFPDSQSLPVISRCLVLTFVHAYGKKGQVSRFWYITSPSDLRKHKKKPVLKPVRNPSLDRGFRVLGKPGRDLETG